MTQAEQQGAGPYAQAFEAYLAAGWRGVLPLPARRKTPPPDGYTGRVLTWPSVPDVYTWADGREGHGNIALRLPQHVIGIDVDAYDGKPGAATLAAHLAQHGDLPPTWRSTSRDDGISGISLYRVPEGLHWPGDLGGGIEVIQYRHRYVVAPPSLHPEGRAYRWITPDGATSATAVPHVDDLPWLPDAWIGGLTNGEAERSIDTVDLGDDDALIWLGGRPAGNPCRAVDRALAGYLEQLRSGQRARHEIALSGTARLAHLAAEGHTGTVQAVATLREAFLAASTAPGSGQREHHEAAAEWGRLITGAVRIAAASPCEDDDPCDNPFAGLVDLSAPAAAPLPPEVEEADFDPSRAEILEAVFTHADLSWAATGDIPEVEPPAWGRRDDGIALWYAGKVNGVFGDPESAKTWLAMQALVEALLDGQRVVLIDIDHNGAVLTVQRLLMLGADSADLSNPDLFRYYAPDDRLELGASIAQAAAFEPAVAVLDSLGELVPMMGRDSKDNDQITTALRLTAFVLARSGAAVITVDHLPKAGESRDSGYAIGGMAKKRAMDGSYIRAEVRKAPAPGQVGKVTLRVAKDRAGRLREHAPNGFIGTFIMDSTIPGSVVAHIEGPIEATPEQRESFRPTGLMQKVSHYLAGLPEGASQRDVERDVSGKRDYIRQALKVLVDEGYVERSDSAKRVGGGFVYVLKRAYFETNDLLSGGPE